MFLFPVKTYLDHNATTPLDPEVAREMGCCLQRNFGNASSLHSQGRLARGCIERARGEIAAALGCAPVQLLFTSGGTEANNTVIKGVFAEQGKGHIITTKIEHESILGACRQVEQLGAAVTYLPAGTDGLVSPEAVEAAIRPETILISVMHANNEIGAVQPVERIAEIARQHGIAFHTDAVQSFGKIEVKPERIGCDFLTITAHKINGPKGVGALFFNGKHRFSPLNFGGSQERELRAGTEGTHQIVGFGVAARLASARRRDDYVRYMALRGELISDLRELCPEVQINEAGETAQLPGTVSATFPGKDGLRLLAGLDCYEVAVSIGSACTADKIEPSHVILGMGHDEAYALSTIRISMGRTTRRRNIQYLLWALKKVLAGDPEGFSYLDPKHLDAERIGNAFVIDLRFPYERMLAPSIPGAKLWSHIGIERQFADIPCDKEVILMCSTGIFSFSAGYRLARHGHRNVKVVYGGYNAWRALHSGLSSS